VFFGLTAPCAASRSTLKAILPAGLAICNFQKQRGLSRRFNELDDFEGKFLQPRIFAASARARRLRRASVSERVCPQKTSVLPFASVATTRQ
jgi:hypothetical protein